MDMDSSDKNMERIKEVDETSLLEKPNLDSFVIKDEQRGENFTYENDVQNEEVYQGSPMQHADVQNDEVYQGSPMQNEEVYQGSPMQNEEVYQGSPMQNEGVQSPVMRSNSTDSSSPPKNYEDSDLNHDDEKRMSDYSSERQEDVPIGQYHSRTLKEEAEGADHDSLPGEFLDNNAKETFNSEFQTDYSYSPPHNTLLAGDDGKLYDVMDGQPFNQHTGRSPSLDETSNGGPNRTSAFHHEKGEIDAEMDARNLSHAEAKEGDYPSVEASENGGMVWENSSPHSPQRNQNASPSPERQFSISAERSPHPQPSPRAHPSSRQKELSSPTNSDKKPAPSSSPPRRKRSPSPENHGVVRKRSPSPENRGVVRRRTSSRDHSSPHRQKSPPGRVTQRDSHQRDNSPKRRVSASPRTRDSPRRKGRSTSRSPVRRRESPGSRRDQRRRSRSRSPIARDHHRRSPRRRHSPRRRSPPPSYSRRRSPRRPWLPPPNRSTGLGKPGNNLFVAGFSYVTTERDLEKKFSRFGRVTDVRIVRNIRSGESRGFGFVSLEKDEDADAAIRAVDQTEWNGRIVMVEKSKSSTR